MVGGQAYPQLRELLTGMEMTEEEGGMSRLELRFTNIASNARGGARLAFESGDVLTLGKDLTVYAGDELAPREIFRGLVTAVEAHFPADGSPEFVVLAEDGLQRARLARRTRTFENQALADLVRTVASDAGLTPVINGLSDVVTTVAQLNESDLAFLRRVLARYDADLQVVGTELHASPRGDVRRGDVRVALHNALRSARVTADLADQVTKVTVSGFDGAQGARIAVSSSVSPPGPGRGVSGDTALRQALGDRSVHVGHLAAADDREAQALADAAFAQRARRFVRLEGVARGNADIRVGAHVEVEGLGRLFDNTYYVTRAIHRYGVPKPGYQTEFEGECAFWTAA